MWLTIGAVALLAGVISFVTFARLSIEFTGGIQLQTMQEITQDDVETLREALATDGIVINEITTNTENDIATLLIKLNITDEQVQSTLDTLETQLITQNTIESQDDIISLSFIGPSIGDYIKRSAIRALAIGV
jgi:preprotein translocase subunit SecF